MHRSTKLIKAAVADRPGLRVTLDFSYPVLKMKEDRRLQVRDLVLGMPLTGGEDRCEWDGVVLSARQEISADVTEPSQVIVRFNGGLGCDLSCHVDEVEREYDGVIEKKVKQGARVPTILVVSLSRLGWSWLRPIGMWRHFLESRLEPSSPHRPLHGLGIMISSIDQDLPDSLCICLRPGAPAALEEAAGLLNRGR